MQVKTFSGASSQEVLAQIKRELGADAVILSNRTYRKNGVLCHEIMAGVERAAQGGSGAQLPAGAAPLPSSGVGWSEWHKDWLRVREQLFLLMKPAVRMDRLTPRQRVALEYLQREGVSDGVSIALYNMLAARPGASVLESLASMVPIRSWGGATWPQRVHLFAGPYGNGKTTAALRCALHLRAEKPETQIAFINADCLRGNGRLTLRHWAELSDFGYLEAADPEGMRKALALTAEAGAVFIDTPGMTQEMNLAQWRHEMGIDGQPHATHLVMCPFYDGVQMQALLHRYAVNGDASLVWTKLDESVCYGALVNVAYEARLPISAISYGPELKQSLSPATEPLIWRLIFKRQLPIQSGDQVRK